MPEQVRVKLKTIYASVNGTASPGSVIPVDIEEAKDLVNGGYAENVDKIEQSIEAEVKAAKPVESTSAESEETARAEPASAEKPKKTKNK